MVYSCGGGGGGGSVSAPHSYIPKPPSKQPVVVTPSVTYKLTYNIPASKINAGDTVYLARLNLSSTAYTTPSSAITLSQNLKYNNELYSATPEKLLRFPSANMSYRIDSPMVSSFNNSKEAFAKIQSNTTSRAVTQPFNEAGAAKVGTTIDIKVVEYTNGRDMLYPRKATLKQSTSYTNVWFVDGTKDARGNIINVNEIQTMCNNIASKFDQIYTIERNIFGEERNKSVYNPSANPVSTKVNIVIANLNSKYDGPYLGGYFFGIDYYDHSFSNYGKFFYIDAAITKLNPKESYSTLAHEFQHMIQINQKEDCETWFNEMLSMTAEDLLAPIIFDSPVVTDGKSFPFGSVQDSRVYRYNKDSYYLSGITDWLDGEYVLHSYSTAYMFGAYLFRNYGANYISTLSKSSKVGDMTLIKNTLGANYDAMLKNYYKALLPPYNRQNTPSFYKDAAFQGYTLPKIKIDEVIYWKIENGQIVNAGPVGAPKIFEKTDTLPNLRPYGMIIQRISTGGNGGAATITVSKSATENCYIVVVKSDGTIEEFLPSSCMQD